ncbi:MAG: SDR family oxidoreductase [Bacteroidales bacterium]|jgi:3-oxoacyl-[acyl-carrier protein] reductase
MRNNKKFALITASTKGIGKEIAKALINKDYFVFINYNKDDEFANKLNVEFNDKRDCYRIIKADMSNTDGMEFLYKNIISITKTLDCIILNVGATCKKSFSEITIEEWNKVFNVNLAIPFFLIQKFKQNINNNGRIIFISSVLGSIPHAISIPYSVSKAGINMLAKSLVREFCNKNITVNAIAPGFIDTQWQKDKPHDLRTKIENKIALKRFGTPMEVAAVCMCIIENQYLNGAIIHIDGGYDLI